MHVKNLDSLDSCFWRGMDKELGLVGKDFGPLSCKEQSSVTIAGKPDVLASGSVAAQGMNTDRFGETVIFL